jgi:hypothetical protein
MSNPSAVTLALLGNRVGASNPFAFLCLFPFFFYGFIQDVDAPHLAFCVLVHCYKDCATTPLKTSSFGVKKILLITFQAFDFIDFQTL